MLLRLLISVLAVVILIAAILLNPNTLTSLKLGFWWWQFGNAEQGVIAEPKPNLRSSELTASSTTRIERYLRSKIDESDIPKIKQSILFTLTSKDFDDYRFEAAMAFAQVFKDDPNINEQLIIIAFDHPDKLVRCFWQSQLKTGHNLLIITSSNEQKKATSFSLRDKEACGS